MNTNSLAYLVSNHHTETWVFLIITCVLCYIVSFAVTIHQIRSKKSKIPDSGKIIQKMKLYDFKDPFYTNISKGYDIFQYKQYYYIYSKGTKIFECQKLDDLKIELIRLKSTTNKSSSIRYPSSKL